MDKNILKKFAIESRKLLEEKVADRINLYYVDEDFNEDKSGEVITLINEKHNLTLTSEEYGYRQSLLNRIKKYHIEYGDGLSHVIEEAAFTWFNRLVCLRYMELHDFLPLTKEKESLNIRVLSSRENEAEPEIMKNVNLHNPELDIKVSLEKLDKITNINDRFEYVLLKVCEKMGEVLPQIFDGETDYIELLIPKNLLNADSFLDKLIKEVPEDNFNDIEIIGWFYQYYNQSEKDKAMKEKRAYKKSEIPYVTQIFTPDWIVKYMVENSLGRLWVEKNGDEEIIKEFKYFIKDNIEIDNKGIMPENITFIDPCMGSGHILVYAFEVFVKLYIQAGYNKKDIPELILKNNLYGLDIDDRAGQFAILSIVLKAREYDKDIFNKIEFNKLNILSIQETNTDVLQWTRGIRDNDIRETIEYLIETFKNAKEIGSLLIVEDRDYRKVEEYLNKINGTSPLTEQLIKKELVDVVRVAKILSKKYDVVVTNPPYLSISKMEEHIKPYIEHYYKDSKADLCTAFMETQLVEKERYLAIINMQSWMFLLTYEELRKKIVKCKYITNLMHLGAHAFEEMSGEVLQTVSVVFKEGLSQNKNGNYIRLVDIDDAEKKETEFFNYKNLFNINQQKFENIPDAIYGYWLSDGMIDVFKNSNKLSDIAEPKQGMVTRDNNRFIRAWWEVNFDNIEYNVKNHEESYKSSKKWYPITDGGTYRKWYGNIQSVVNFLHDGKEIIDFSGSHIKNREYYFRENITWSAISGDSISMRYTNKGFCPEHAGNCLYCDHDKLILLLAICNSNIIVKIMKALSPTLNFNVGQIANIPITKKKIENSEIENNVNKCIKDSKNDWDSFETSWDFKKHPLV